ncbi:hypothetical protein DRN79_01880 [Methanosarcinales archaeon]|nr:MAG: hypothetical protein DRN79_01880 [Methanosarcinales archaeon]
MIFAGFALLGPRFCIIEPTNYCNVFVNELALDCLCYLCFHCFSCPNKHSIKQQMRDYPVTAPVTADIKKLLKEFDLKK